MSDIVLNTTNNNGFEIHSLTYRRMATNIEEMISVCHGSSVAAGWWINDRNVGECLCLIHSEISEAMEGHRKNLMDDHLPNRKMIEVELADALVRICDLAGGLKLNLGDAFSEKINYNQNRADHKLENRMKEGGKKY